MQNVQWTLDCKSVSMIAVTSSTHVLPLATPGLPDLFDVRHQCLDMIPMEWSVSGRQCSESGILVEIWRTGGLLQTSAPLPADCQVQLELTGRTVQARVTSCEQDDYGYLVQVTV